MYTHIAELCAYIVYFLKCVCYCLCINCLCIDRTGPSSILKQPTVQFTIHWHDDGQEPPVHVPVLKWRGGATSEKRKRVTRGSEADWASSGAAIADQLPPPHWSQEDLEVMRRELACPKKARMSASQTRASLQGHGGAGEMEEEDLE